jgi:uncharacterized damage-inducible protein DinB
MLGAMDELTPFRELFEYSDQMNRLVLNRAAALPDDALDRPLDLGPGTLRRILIHTHNGELVWLRRWQGQIETKWPGESAMLSPEEVLKALELIWPERDAFLASLDPGRLDAEQPYRDSRGTLFRATLRRMLLQGIVHSIHHRAQAVNAIRRLGGAAPEVDFIMSVRQPV